jgi:hypothetical protein
MGFLDKAKAAANDLAAKADTAINSGLASSGVSTPGGADRPGAPAAPPGPTNESDRLLRELGALAYLEANGRPVASEERERLLTELRGLEVAGVLGDLSISGGAITPPAPPPPAAPTPQAPVAPPPPPSWAKKDDSSS